jgi:two-component system, chemotaxis family, protein-glutamate methylesterase/glutaminase
VPVLVVQHLHPQLVDGFVGWMQRVSALPVVVAASGDRPQPGVVYVAPAGAHLKLADELFVSVAATAGGQSVGVLLTGMGDDGAAGLLDLRRQGAVTIAQDEPTSVVFGMPQAAQRLGAATEVLGLGQIPGAIRGAVARLVR